MGFFGGLSRFVQGKPVFEVPTDNPTVSNNPDPTSNPGTKSIPTVFIERSACYNTTGTGVRVTAIIRNSSDKMVELDKIRLLGTSTELDTQLRAGESREFKIYDGNRPNNSNYNDAFLVYKDTTGDYFEAYHTVQFRQESDGTYSPQQFRFTGPVKDI